MFDLDCTDDQFWRYIRALNSCTDLDEFLDSEIHQGMCDELQDDIVVKLNGVTYYIDGIDTLFERLDNMLQHHDEYDAFETAYAIIRSWCESDFCHIFDRMTM